MKTTFCQLIEKRRLALWLVLVLVGVGSFGCSTDEPENASSKPWNSPEGYQNGGLPGMMQQPH